MATGILSVDLAEERADIEGLSAYRSALVLVRWRGKPLGQMRVPVTGGRVAIADLWQAAAYRFGYQIAAAVLREKLAECGAGEAASNDSRDMPSASVVVCTRDRVEDLRRCLDAICAAADGETEIVIVDNAPPDDRTARLVAEYPARYVLEPRRGLNWARRAGARAARGEVVIFTDDDVVIERGWIDAMRGPFADPSVAAVTGLVMPLEMETEAQELFERHSGFSRGFRVRELTAQTVPPVAAATAGAGASMAIRRRLINRLDLFGVELDCGTAAQSGGDTYAFYRLLAAGHRIVYQPEAVVWHRHRRTFEELRRTLYGYSVGTYVVLLRCLLDHGDGQAISNGLRWFCEHHLRLLWGSLLRRPGAFPLRLTLAEIRGCLAAPLAYLKTRRRTRAAHRQLARLAGAEYETSL